MAHEPGFPRDLATLVDLLRWRAERQPDSLAYRFLPSGDADSSAIELTYGELDVRARAIGARLRDLGAEGERALLLYPPGLDFVAAFLGCGYAGVVAVPGYPHHTSPRLGTIARDSGARLVLTTGSQLRITHRYTQRVPELEAVEWIATDSMDLGGAKDWRRPEIDGDTLAFLQYTSGSTAAPKGVMISHANILHNQRVITDGFGTDDSTHVLGWLPLYHDMGLIGNVLHPLYLGASCTLMSPLSFLQRPLRWLKAISDFGATVSGGPNFAYDLCVRRIRPEDRGSLDLSSWRVAFNGAEPVRAETLDRFASAFADSGFRVRAGYPCYGLAESTLYVTGTDRDTAPSTIEVDAEALSRNVVTENGAAPRVLVSMGRGGRGHRVVIVDPETHLLCRPRTVGEIWVTGPSVARGYWGRPELSAEVFGARLADSADDTVFLRTGDLGFVLDGELFVTGRLKDVIIVRARNFYPQDIELTAEHAHPAVRQGDCAAFAIEIDGEERLAVTAEAELDDVPGGAEEVIDAIRQAVIHEHDVPAHTVALLRPRSIPKTSSGKIQRHACRTGLIEGNLRVLASSVAEAPAILALGSESADAWLREELASANEPDRHRILEDFVRRAIAGATGTDPSRIGPSTTPAAAGVDSLMGVELQSRVEDTLDLTLPVGFLWQQPTVAGIVGQLMESWRERRRAEPVAPAPDSAEPLASSGQERLWFLDRLSPGTAAYNLHYGIRIGGALDVGLLAKGLTELVWRHAVLRTVLRETDAGLRQVVLPPSSVDLGRLDLSGIPVQEREAALRHTANALASETFDLAAGPLLRCHLVTHADDEHVLLVTQHHTITDGWSAGVLARELAAIYEALARDAPLPPRPRLRFLDYAHWERATAAAAEDEREFWARRLSGLERLDLPGDRPRGTPRSHRGGRVPLELSRGLSQKLMAIGREEGCTPFVTLLAGYAAFLCRYTGQEDFAVGTVVLGRGRPELRELIGFLANTVAVRCDLSGTPDFRELLRRFRDAVAEALAHSELPFAEVVRATAAARQGDDSPLFEASFVLENNQTHRLEPAGTTWRPVTWSPDGAVDGTAKFELSLALEEVAGGYAGTLEYDADRFEPGTVRRMAAGLRMLLAGFATAPDNRVDTVPLIPGEERRLLAEWNDTAAEVPGTAGFPELFERQVGRTPDRTAVVCEGTRLTYRELNALANRLANHLRGKGVGRDGVVGLLLPRGPELLVAILAVFKAGAAYVPLDPNHPVHRHLQILGGGRVPWLIGTRELTAELRELPCDLLLAEDIAGLVESQADLRLPIRPHDLAYVIFTSGSTGEPKGAMVEHFGMINHLYAKIRDLGLGAGDIIAQTASQCFDISVWQFLSALLLGGQVDIVPEAVANDPRRLFERTAAHGTTILEVVPSLLRAALEDLDDLEFPALRWLLVTGEALAPELARHWLVRQPKIPLLNAYGPTECSDDVAHYAIPEPGMLDTANTPIGYPILNTQLHVLDESQQPVPLGVLGELYVGGHGVGRGYLGRPDLTAECFVPGPFSGVAGGRLYRTGDVARWLADGRLEFVGRVDHQVKVRGFRIELGEIETVLRTHPGVRDVVVVLREDVAGDQRLVGYVVTGGADIGELRDYASTRLPAYMVPSAFVPLDALPLTPNGKLDRSALPVPSGADSGAEYTTPQGPVEELLAGVWAEVLGVRRVGSRDDFFALGGHSLLATQVVARIRRIFGVELPLRRLFEDSTLAGLARAVEQARADGVVERLPAIERVDRAGVVPASFAQQRLWFLDQLSPGGVEYNVPGAVRIRGPLDVDALRASLTEIVRRHEVLRTTFTDTGEGPVQVVAPEPVLDFGFADVSDVAELAEREARVPFDLSHGPLVRVRLLRLTAEDHVLLLTMHHIVSDGWSLGVLMREASVLYDAFVAGAESPLPELPVQYVDYAVWQRDWLRGAVLDEQVAYWRGQLAGAPPALELPTDRPRPVTRSGQGGQCPVSLDPPLVTGLRALGRGEGATLFMTLLAGFQVLLARYSGQTDVLVGSPIAGRTRAELEDLIGFFVNTVVLRADVSEGPGFRELLGRVRDTTLDAYAHQNVPFEKLVEVLAPPRDLARTPLFQVMFVLQNAPGGQLEFGDARLEPMDLETGTAKFELTLSLEETEHGVHGFLEYDTDLFDTATAERLVREFETLLTGIVADPELPVTEQPLLTERQRHQILEEWNNTDAEIPDLAVHQLFEAQVARTPEAVALIHGDRSITYTELNQQANRIARSLLVRDTGAHVGIHMGRSIELVAAQLGILKAGKAYVSLDPAYPAERLEMMVGTTGISVVLTAEELGGAAIETQDDSDPGIDVHGDDAAYLIFTSGSTGVPNAVIGLHRGAVNRMAWMWRQYPFGEDEVCVLKTSPNFVDSVWETFGPLLCGVPSVILDDDTVKSPPELLDALAAAGVTRIVLVPTLIRALLAEDPDLARRLPRLRYWTSSGEALPVDLLRTFQQCLPDRTLLNLYGSSEVAADSLAFDTRMPTRSTGVPIGEPIDNTRVYLLDRWLQPVPVGVPGEVYLGGAGLARGYLNRPDLTAKCFVPDPFSGVPGARLYRTGDVARWLADGQLEFVGRVDHQVKVRGFRIELGEIEAVLADHPKVRDVVAMVRTDAPGDPRLVAYVATDTGEAAELRDYASTRLPGYLVPSAFVPLDALPLTPNGKVNRLALPAPSVELAGAEHIAPRGPTEELIAGIWAEVLGVRRVGSTDDFFALGGHSLLATQVAARIRRVFGVALPLRRLFEASTVTGLATAVDGAVAEQLPAIARVDRAGVVPVSFAQQRLWFLDQLSPGGVTYTVPGAVRIRGPLDVDALRASLREIVRRHEILRTTFVDTGEGPVQIIAPELLLDIEITDTADPAELAGREARVPFDLSHGPLVRVRLLRLAADDHVLLLTMHHIVSDGWSLGVLIREASALYNAFASGLESPLPALPVQYADFAAWQRDWLRGAVLDEQVAYWREQLAGAPPALELPTDRPRPAVRSGRGGRCPVTLDAALVERLRELGRDEGATLFMTLLAGFQVLLARHSGQSDVLVGSPIAGRTRTELEDLIGFFVNTMVLRVNMSDAPGFRQLLGRVRDITLDAYAHQDVPFEKLVEILAPPRDLTRTPLFQVMFVLQNAPTTQLELGDATLEPVDLDTGTAKFELTLSLEEADHDVHGFLEYDTDLFEHGTAQRLAAEFHLLLAGIVAEPDRPVTELPLLTQDQRHRLLTENNTTTPVPDNDIHQLFEQWAARTPDAAAVVSTDGELTYAEVNRQANRIARWLRERGVGPEVSVAILVEPSLDMMPGLLGILKAGGGYVPLDPRLPPDRVEYLLRDSRASLLLTTKALSMGLDADIETLCLDEAWETLAGHESSNLPDAAPPASRAYTIYTSGSTGRPKGVVVERRRLLNYFAAITERFGLEPGMRYTMLAPLSVDACLATLIPAICGGGTLHVLPPGSAADPDAVRGHFRRHRIDVLRVAPTHLAALLEARPTTELLPRHALVLGGEGSPWDWVRDTVQPLAPDTCATHIHYGPTEACVAVLTNEITAGQERRGPLVPLGRPLANTRVYVLDPAQEPVSVGVPGEIYLAGDCLARGYLDRPELTAASFLPDPHGVEPGGRMYRTGDLGRRLPDGRIEFLGRFDDQVKVRGFRIEPGEITAALEEHPAVHHAVTVAKPDGTDKRLVSYVVPGSDRGDEPGLPRTLRAFLRGRLPDYMVPSAVVPLAALPRTPQGKVDLDGLPDPMPLETASRAPATLLEAQLTEIWAQVLGTGPVGVDDDFFELGGHSLLAVRIMTAIRTRLARQVSLDMLFRAPTVTAQARALREDEPRDAILVPVRDGGAGAPLVLVHPIGGELLCYAELSTALGDERPLLGVRSPRVFEGEVTLERMAAVYNAELRRVVPDGPYHLAGWSTGGVLAFEMARQLGDSVGLLALFDTHPPAEREDLPVLVRFAGEMGRLMGKDLTASRDHFEGLDPDRQRAVLAAMMRAEGLLPPEDWAEELSSMLDVFTRNSAAVAGYRMRRTGHRLALFSAAGEPAGLAERWAPWAGGGIESYPVPGDHHSMLRRPHVVAVAEQLTRCLDRVDYSRREGTR
jgi:amino acid adenylation domain-containing protein